MTDADANKLLIAYDGSAAARNAIAHAARLFPGASATVTTVWTSVAPAAPAARIALSDDVIDEAVRNLDAVAERDAAQTAEDGAGLARSAGLDASPLALRAEPSVWASIVGLAHEREALAVVVGSRGLSALRSVVLGSVTNAVVQHCRRPILVVHPAADGG
jgi:nucleotide-binding universal stress UspA family protein